MKYEYLRFDARLSAQEREALENLAEKQGVTMSEWFKSQIQRCAKRQKCWPNGQ